MEKLKLVADAETDLAAVMHALGRDARAAARRLALASDADRSRALTIAA